MLYLLVSLTFAALCSAELFCNGGTTQSDYSCKDGKSLYCCYDIHDAWNAFNNERKGCGSPIEGPPQECDRWDSDTKGCDS
ncbi:hypothetical protein BUE80_DR000832 [Diplocarpon rosae]|nr:hypothetical protein BUE80_DR000832 [Diplocarpon rosae]